MTNVNTRIDSTHTRAAPRLVTPTIDARIAPARARLNIDRPARTSRALADAPQQPTAFTVGIAPPRRLLPRRNLLREALRDNARDAERAAPNATKRQQAELDAFVAHFEKYRERYERVAAAAGVPAELVAAIHYRESSLSFDTYLHNGQKLGQTTTIVPKGIYFGKGQWEEAAIDALTRGRKGLIEQLGLTPDTTDIGTLATFAECYNGLGYQRNGRVSAYVWSGTDVYEGGMYVADGRFDPNKRDPRPGVVALLWAVSAARPS